MLPFSWLLGLALCGAAGTLCRYGAAVLLKASLGDGFAWGTLVVNVLGCFLMGWLAAATPDLSQHASARWRLFAGVGFLGGFTTFSAFGLETYAFLEKGSPQLALANVAANVLLGIVAVAAGMWIGTR